MIMLLVALVLLFIDITFCIQYGTDVFDMSQYPFYIMIGNPHICGGTLLSYDPPLVLTAAHCVADAELTTTKRNPYFVNYYNVHRDKQRSLAIVDWKVHPLYNVSSTINMNYDVAIVQLGSPLRKSARVKRVPLWSPSMTSSLPTRGELIGFGFTGLNKPEAQILQRLQLDITRFDPNRSFNVEAKSDTEEHVACHGDSGSPLVVYHSVTHPTSHKNITVPFVVGNLARIFGAHDLNQNTLTCPIPHEIKNHNSSSWQNTVTESFCNTASMIDWISEVTHISKDNLSDPFYTPPHPPCKNCKVMNSKGNNSNTVVIDDDDDDDDDDEEDTHAKWHIGVVAADDEENGFLLDNNTDPIWIGSMNKDFLIEQVAGSANSSNTLSLSLSAFVLLIFIISFINC